MSKIDLHAHYVPRFYRDALAAAGHEPPDGIKRTPDWDEARALRMMDQLDVRTAVLSISSPGVHFGDTAEAAALARLVNEEGARLAAAHPDRFGFFASVPLPAIDEAVAEIEYALDHLGADGIVLLTNHRGVYLGDPLLEPVYAQISARQSTIFVHPTAPFRAEHLALGYPQPLLEFLFDTTRSIADLVMSGSLARHPGMRVVVPHAAAALPVVASRIELFLPLIEHDPELVPSFRDALQDLHFDIAGAPIPELLQALLLVANPGHVHYGSDYPFTPSDMCLALARQIETTPLLKGDLLTNVLSENSSRLLRRLEPPSYGPAAPATT